MKKKRPIYPKIDISGLDKESQLDLLKALAEEERKNKNDKSKPPQYR